MTLRKSFTNAYNCHHVGLVCVVLHWSHITNWTRRIHDKDLLCSISVLTLVLIAHAVFLLEGGQICTQTYKVTDVQYIPLERVTDMGSVAYDKRSSRQEYSTCLSLPHVRYGDLKDSEETRSRCGIIWPDTTSLPGKYLTKSKSTNINQQNNSVSLCAH